MFNLQIKTPCRMFFAGATTSGKTYRLFQILRQREFLFKNPESVKNVILFYNVLAKEHERNADLITEWVNEIPTIELVQEKIKPYEKTGCFVIFDDFGKQIEKNTNLVECFTVLSHHGNISFALLLQNLFPKNGREFRLNATHTFIFKQDADKTPITNFARQYKPKNISIVEEAFDKATKDKEFPYLCIIHQNTFPECLRMCTGICIDEWPPQFFFSP